MSIDPKMALAADVVLREGMTIEKVKYEAPIKTEVPLLRNEEVIEYPADPLA